MNLPDLLGYRLNPANPLQRVLQRLAWTRSGARALSRTLHFPDRLLFRATGGRATVSSLVAGLPVVLVTTTGARTGRTRTTPLTAVPIDGMLALIGTNFGQAATPGWVYNLERHAEAAVTYGKRTVRVRARRADPWETSRVFETASVLYGGYSVYRRRAHARTIRVFLLLPAG